MLCWQRTARRIACHPQLGLAGVESFGVTLENGNGGVVVLGPGRVLPPRLLAWRHLPEHRVIVIASRDEAVVLQPWRRGVNAVAAALVAVLGIAAAYSMAAASARARARAADAALTLSEARAALVADALDVAIWFRNTPTGITRFFGDSVTRITGHDRQFLESRRGTWTDVVQHPADRPALRAARAAADAADARGEPASDRSATFRIVRPDGTVRWLHSRTRRLGDGSSVGVLHDVTELTHAQSALARREAELGEVLRLAGIGTLRLPPGRHVVEPSAELAAGWGLAEGGALLSLEEFAAMITPETRAAAMEAFAAVRRTGGSADVEFAVRLPNGSVRLIWSRARCETDPDGERGAVVVVCQDITERRAAQTALAQAQRMSALGHLTGGVAHDLNNLLTVVLLNLEGVMEELPPGSLALAATAQAVRAAETAARLTAQLLAFAGRQPLRPESLDPSAVLAELVPMFGRALGPRIAVAVNVALGTPSVYADPTQLRTALLNLAANARDAMDGTGRLVITVGPDSEGNVAFAVTDEGSGMSEDVAARAFEPFFTTKPAGQGSGLGLSQAYGFVAQSRGTIGIESTPGFGTTVRFVLPSAPGDGRPRRDVEEAAHAALVA
ncbi:PAS domain-containing sensor histidine kinase [Elioraea rosea]|uniref:PAS domain-containing sensor histidine kinase n=1 Tax=Elioraea rosea TaxID=2492390 RepID=UPI001315AAE7|nr:ATP-binding protein [Elioraea rosea]